MFITSFILENKYHNERVYMKKECYIDYIIRFIACIIAFTELGLSIEMKLVLSSIALFSNILIEFRINRMKETTKRDISESIFEKKIDIKNANKSVTMGITLFMIIASFYGNMMVLVSQRLYISIIMVVGVFLIFCKVEFNRIFMCYKNQNDAKKVYINSIASFGIGNIIWILQKIYFKNDFLDNLTMFIIIISLTPSIFNTRNIGIILKRYQDR